MPTLMERQLDESAGFLLEQAIKRRGIDVITRASTEAILGEHGRSRACGSTTGARYPADIVVMAVGIRPNAALAGNAGLMTGRGIIVNDRMETSDPRHLRRRRSASEHRGMCYGLVAPLYEMAGVIADQLTGTDRHYTRARRLSTRLKVSGDRRCSRPGTSPSGEEQARSIVFRDAPTRRLPAAGAQGRQDHRRRCSTATAADGAWFFQLLQGRRRHRRDCATRLIFGQAFAGGAQADPSAAVAALADAAEICGCNGVCKGKIIVRHRRQGAEDARGRARPHQGARAPAAPAPAWSRSCCRRRSATPTVRRPGEAGLRLHRARPRRGAPADRGAGAPDDPGGDAGARLEDPARLR